MTDVIFNTGSILFPIVGFYAKIWWLDALGGLLLSAVVIFNWSQTSMHHVRNLTGFSATSDERNLCAYMISLCSLFPATPVVSSPHSCYNWTLLYLTHANPLSFPFVCCSFPPRVSFAAIHCCSWISGMWAAAMLLTFRLHGRSVGGQG